MGKNSAIVKAPRATPTLTHLVSPATEHVKYPSGKKSGRSED